MEAGMRGGEEGREGKEGKEPPRLAATLWRIRVCIVVLSVHIVVLSVVCCQWCVVSGVLSVACCQWCVVPRVLQAYCPTTA